MNSEMESTLSKRDSTAQLEFDWPPQPDQTDQAFPRTMETPPKESPLPPTQSIKTLSSKKQEDDQAQKALQAVLETRSGRRIASLVITNNTSTMMSVKYHPQNASAILRLHNMFLSAPEQVLDALAQWIKSPRSKKTGGILNDYIKQNSHLRLNHTRKSSIITKGTYFNLREIFDTLNQEHFKNRISANITWGKFPEAKRRRSIRFGAYYPTDDVIRIHRFLDQPFVPKYFVQYIVFHEMLHAFLGIKQSPSGRQIIHPSEFKALEKRFPEYEKAIAWENDPKNLKRLLSKKTGFHSLTLSRFIDSPLFGKD